MEVWFYLALLSAGVVAVLNLFIKDLGGKIDEYAAGFIRNLVILPALWMFLFFAGIPSVDPIFWKYILIMLPFEVLLVTFYQKAFKLSPLSLIVPILALSPIFIALLSFLLFKENLTLYHLLSLIFFVSGVYVLNLRSGSRNPLAPLESLFKDKGVFYMLLVAIILGVTVSLGKRAIIASSPEFFSAVYYSFVSILLFPIYKLKSKVKIREFIKHKKSLLILGICTPVNALLVFYAFKTGPTAMVQAVTSINILFSVILAGTFLKEKGIMKRILASMLIVIGAAIIILK